MKMLVQMVNEFFARDYNAAALEALVEDGNMVIVFENVEQLDEFAEENEIDFREI